MPEDRDIAGQIPLARRAAPAGWRFLRYLSLFCATFVLISSLTDLSNRPSGPE